MLPRRTLILLASIPPLAAGCATVVSGRTSKVALRSNPPESQVTIRDHNGDVVARTLTPGVVELRRGRTWLRPASYDATFEKAGFLATTTPIHSKFNPWAIGNIAIGGGLGLGVDLATGAAWQPKLSTIEQSLARVESQYGAGHSLASDDPTDPSVQMASATEDPNEHR